MKQNVAVIVLTMDQRKMTLACLASLMLQEGTFQVLLWDNGSQDGTAAAVGTAFPTVTVHEHPHNLGVASGRNRAAELANRLWQPDYLLFLDNDMTLEPGFLVALLAPFTQVAGVGQTQAKLRFMDDRERLNDGGGARIDFVRWQITPVGYQELDRGQYDAIRPCICCGGAMMVRAELFLQLGGFDALFDPYGPEDLDFSLRLQEAGHKALFVPQAVAYHAVSHTYGRDYGEEYARHKSRHWFLFMRRHGSLSEQLRFFLWGAPVMALRVLWREGRQGNLRAVRGLLRGVFGSVLASAKRQGGGWQP